jgi:hypothetical protein
MKYVLKIVNPILKFTFAILFFVLGNIFYFLFKTIWDIKFPSKTSIKEFNEHYRRFSGYTMYYKTYIHYAFDYGGYTKIYK